MCGGRGTLRGKRTRPSRTISAQLALRHPAKPSRISPFSPIADVRIPARSWIYWFNRFPDWREYSLAARTDLTESGDVSSFVFDRQARRRLRPSEDD